MEHNIDHQEVEKFNHLASRWWDLEGDLKTLHEINPYRLDFINSHVTLAGKKILDVGCGGGILSESLALQGALVTGIDMSESALQVAKLHALDSNISVDYQQITAEDMAAKHPNKFDVLVCMELLEHVPDPASIIQACANLTAPGGDLFFSTLNRNAKAYLGAIIGAEYILKILPIGTHDYRKFIRPSELEAWLRVSGLNLKHITGLHYNPFTKNYSLKPDVSINYLVHAVKDTDV